jgi:small subunit ribosomal protein S3Ae
MANKVSAKARAAARKQRDKWKNKRWYTIRAPRHPWDFKKIGETLGESDEFIIGRIYTLTQQEFSGDFTKLHVILKFKVTECVGQDALTQFIGHEHQSDHVRRQIRRYRGKIEDVVDVVTNDGYLVRLKPLIITQQRVQTSVKHALRLKCREIILGYSAKNTFAQLQEGIMNGKLEEEIQKVAKTIYPLRSVAIRKSQLLQEGVIVDKGPTLDEIHAEEARIASEMKAKKAALLAQAMEDEASDDDESEEDEPEVDASDESTDMESEAAPEPEIEDASNEEVAEEPASVSESVDYSSMTVAELKELLKAAGKPVSGKKDELIARLQE